jgi:RNA polymerase sigma factor (sigma-70 family)
MPSELVPMKLAEGARFCTTRWSLVLRAGQEQMASAKGQHALEELCRAYWYPLYAFVRRRGYGAQDAQDLTQSFFARLLDKNTFAMAEQQRGRFRTFLLTALDHFLVSEWERGQRQKRGGGREIVSIDALATEERYHLEPVSSSLTPEQMFERRWVESLLEQVLRRLREECETTGHLDRFEHLKMFLVEDRGAVSFAATADRLGVTEAALKGMVRRLRARYRELLREEVAQTVGSAEEIEAEIRYLIRVLNT